MFNALVNRFSLRSKGHIRDFDIEDNYRLPISQDEGVVQLLVDELKRRIEKEKLFIVRVSRTSNVVYLHTIMYAQKVEFNRVSQHYQHPNIIRILCVLRDLKREGDFTISYYDANKNIIEEHRFTTLPSFLSHIDTLNTRILDSEQLHYRDLKPYPMGTLSQQQSLVSLLHFQQDFKSELIAKRGFNGEVLRDCQLIYETPENQKVGEAGKEFQQAIQQQKQPTKPVQSSRKTQPIQQTHQTQQAQPIKQPRPTKQAAPVKKAQPTQQAQPTQKVQQRPRAQATQTRQQPKPVRIKAQVQQKQPPHPQPEGTQTIRRQVVPTTQQVKQSIQTLTQNLPTQHQVLRG